MSTVLTDDGRMMASTLRDLLSALLAEYGDKPIGVTCYGDHADYVDGYGIDVRTGVRYDSDADDYVIETL